MYLHKYKKGNMTFYGITDQKKAPAIVELSKDSVTDSVPFKDVIKSYIGDLNGAIDKMKIIPKEEKPEESKEPEKSEKPEKSKKPEKSEKTAVSDVIRKYAQIMDSLNKD